MQRPPVVYSWKLNSLLLKAKITDFFVSTSVNVSPMNAVSNAAW